MEKKASKATELYHKFFVYLPPLLVIFLITMIYVSYCVNYIGLLLINYNPENENLKNILKYPFPLSSSPTKSYAKGVVLVIFTSIFLIILLICLIRTIFSDPGEFPDPIDLEFNIVMNNLLYEQQCKDSSINKRSVDSDKNNLNNILDKEINKLEIKKKYDYIKEKKKEKSEIHKKENEKDVVDTEKSQNNYFTENSIELFKNETLNMINFRKNIQEAPICFEEYNKRTDFLENWRYVHKPKIEEKVKENNYVENKEINKANLNNEIKRGTFKLDNNNKINYNSYYDSIDATRSIIHANLINDKEIELFEDKKLNCNNKDLINSNNPILNDKFEGYLGYDVGKAFLCGTCVRIKVERSHHCKQCGKCILKMDHHCPWLANCIGYSNYKYFLLTHFYGIVLCLFVLFSYWETIFNNCFDYYTSVLTLSWNMFVYANTLGLFMFLVWLFYVNWNLMFQGLTVIENADRERFPSAKFNNPYDLGYYKNFVSVFGTNPLIWFLPIKYEDKYKGIYFKKNNEREERLLNYI